MQLTPHPSTPLPADWSLMVEWRAAVGDALELCWRLHAPSDAVRIPAPREPARRDGLWRHTCFELFLADPVGTGYREFNFSPSGEWAAYTFTDYRHGMAPLPLAVPPRIEWQPEGTVQQLAVVLPRAALRVPSGEAASPRRCGFTAVIERIDGSICYAALAHPGGRPDFHHADGFAAVIEA
jgi:hypothetical protein